jgi:hypothetical protein
MPLPDRAGTFRAIIRQSGFQSNDATGSAGFTYEAFLTEWYSTQEDKWHDCSDQDFAITGYLNLVKRDGSVNERGRNTLIEVFGWDGADFNWFATMSDANPRCQLVVEYEEYKGKQVPKPQWINPADAKPGGLFKKASATEISAAASKFGAKFRSLGTVAKVTPPKSPPPAPSAPAAPPPPPESAASQTFGARTKDEAWKEWCDATLNGQPDVQRWQKAVSAIGKHESDFTADDWRKVGSNAAPI